MLRQEVIVNCLSADDPQPSKPTGPGLVPVSSPGRQSLVTKENSVSVPPSPSVDSVFSDSSIQRIIDRYTRELDLSLSAAGTTTGADQVYSPLLSSNVKQTPIKYLLLISDSEGQSLVDSGSSVSQQPLVGSSRTGDEASAGHQDILVSHTSNHYQL